VPTRKTTRARVCHRRAIDRPGFNRGKAPIAVRRELAQVIESYLSAKRPTALVVQIVDSRHAPTALDLEMNKWMVGEGLPIRVVCSKIDKLARRDQQTSIRRAQTMLGQENIIPFSSETGEGKRELWQVIDNQIASLKARVPVIPTGGLPT
jgi:GTP-binding protein